MRKSFKFKLYNSKRNKELENQLHCAARTYNHFLALSKRYYRIFKKSLSSHKAKLHLTKLKRLEKFSWLRQLNSQTLQDVVERIEKGYKKFFDDLKTKKKTSPPKFKGRRRYKSFTLKQTGYKLLENNRIKIGKRVFKFFKSREIEGKIKTLTIKRDTVGDWFLVFSCELDASQQKVRARTGKSAGFDFGLKCFLIDNEGSKIESPLFLKGSMKELKKKSRCFSRKRKGSNNRRKARLDLARLHIKVYNQRRDFHFKLGKELTEKYDAMFFEDLTLKGMSRLWGRKMSDLGFGEFMIILDYQARKCGAVVHKIDKWYPSSQTCSTCLKKRETRLELSDRTWTCSCGASHDRDHNAAKNILREGASSLGLCGIKTNYKLAASNSRIPRL